MSKSVYFKRIGTGWNPIKETEEKAAVSLEEYRDGETKESSYEIVVGTKDEEISITREIDMDGNILFRASYYNSKDGKLIFIHCDTEEEDCEKNDPTSLYNLVFGEEEQRDQEDNEEIGGQA